MVKEKPSERNIGGIPRVCRLPSALAPLASHAPAAGGHWGGSWAASPAIPMAAPGADLCDRRLHLGRIVAWKDAAGACVLATPLLVDDFVALANAWGLTIEINR